MGRAPRPRSPVSGLAARVIFISLAALLPGCGRDDATPPAGEPAPSDDTVSVIHSPLAHRPEDIDALTVPDELEVVLRPWRGDLPGMAARKLVRIGVGRAGFFYYIQDGRQRGLTSDMARAFEKFLNRRLQVQGAARIHVTTVPMTPDRLIPGVVDGQVDIGGGGLTVTDERRAVVDFATPWITDVRELVVTGPLARDLQTLDELSGREVVVRVSSSYYESLLALNRRLEARGLAPADVVPAHEVFEDEDLLEMVSVGMVGITVCDDYYAEFWAQIFPDLVVRDDLVVREGGQLAWAIRKNSPELAAAIDDFVAETRPGTRLGNIMVRRYLDDPTRVVNALATDKLDALAEESPFFRKYGDQYGFDWLQLAAQAFQESRLDNSRRSPAGAVGIMQVMPETARQMGVADFDGIEGNIRAGTRYMRHLADEYLDEDGLDSMNRWLLALASYNAGGNRIRRLRQEAARGGLDPDQWFGNVEQIAARRLGPETVNYVRNVMKYYLAYRMTFEREQLRRDVLSRVARAG